MNNADQKMKFPSAVAPWFYLLTLVLPTVVIVNAVMKIENVSFLAIGIIVVSTAIAIGIPLWFLFSTYYLVEGGTLKIRGGPVRESIPLSDIKSVKPSRSLLSAPALSLNRLEIVYGRGQSILVSPKDIEGFKRAIGQV